MKIIPEKFIERGEASWQQQPQQSDKKGSWHPPLNLSKSAASFLSEVDLFPYLLKLSGLLPVLLRDHFEAYLLHVVHPDYSSGGSISEGGEVDATSASLSPSLSSTLRQFIMMLYCCSLFTSCYSSLKVDRSILFFNEFDSEFPESDHWH